MTPAREVIEAGTRWFLLRRDSSIFFDVACSHRFCDYLFLMQLNDAEVAAYTAEGRTFLDRFAHDIHYSAPGVKGAKSPFSHRDLSHSLGAEVTDAIVRYRQLRKEE